MLISHWTQSGLGNRVQVIHPVLVKGGRWGRYGNPPSNWRNDKRVEWVISLRGVMRVINLFVNKQKNILVIEKVRKGREGSIINAALILQGCGESRWTAPRSPFCKISIRTENRAERWIVEEQSSVYSGVQDTSACLFWTKADDRKAHKNLMPG
jgi:hypothetical protein